MKTFTMNLDFLYHWPLLSISGSCENAKIPCLAWNKNFYYFCGVELPIRKSTMEGQG